MVNITKEINYSHDDTLIHSQFPTDSPAFVYSTIPTLPDINSWDTVMKAPTWYHFAPLLLSMLFFARLYFGSRKPMIETGRGSPVATVPTNLSGSVAVPSP